MTRLLNSPDAETVSKRDSVPLAGKKKRADRIRAQTTDQKLADSLGINRYQIAEYGQHRP